MSHHILDVTNSKVSHGNRHSYIYMSRLTASIIKVMPNYINRLRRHARFLSFKTQPVNIDADKKKRSIKIFNRTSESSYQIETCFYIKAVCDGASFLQSNPLLCLHSQYKATPPTHFGREIPNPKI